MFSTVVMEVVTYARNRDMKTIENRLKLYINMFSNRRRYKKMEVASLLQKLSKCLNPARPLYGNSCGCKKGLLVL